MARAAAVTSAETSPRFQAMSTPPGASSGNASSTSSGRAATARARTAGQRSRCSGSPARLLRPTGERRDGPRHPDRRRGGIEEADLLRDGVDEQRRVGRERRGNGQPREPATAPQVDEAPEPALAHHGERGEAVDDVPDRNGLRIADRGQVDRLVPGEEESHVPVDRAPLRAAQLDADLLQSGLEGAVIRGGQGWGDVDARRERLALTIQCTPPVLRAVRTCAAPLPAATRIAGGGRSSPVRPVPGSSFPDRLADRVTLPPRCGCRTLRPSPVAVNGVIHQPPARAVDSWITATPIVVVGDVRWTPRRRPVRPIARCCEPADRVSGGPRRSPRRRTGPPRRARPPFGRSPGRGPRAA